MFHPDTIVADALAMHPKTRWVFAAYHLGGCNSCERSPTETLREVADGYRIPLESLLRDLNALLDGVGRRASGMYRPDDETSQKPDA